MTTLYHSSSWRSQILTPNLKIQVQSSLHCFNIPSLLSSNGKTKSLAKFDALYSRKFNPWIGGSTVECSSRGIWGFLESLTLQFPHCEKSGVSHTPIFHSKGLEQTNSKSSDKKQAELHPREAYPRSRRRPKRQWTKRLHRHLHLHLGAVPGILSSCLWVPCHCQMVKWQNWNNLVTSLMSFFKGK